MADSDKNIVITPNISQTADPKIEFKSGATSGDAVTLNVTDDGTISTLSIEGSAGQLFSVSNSLTGTLFSVNDSSGIPSIEVVDDGTIRLAEFSGNVGIGTDTPTTGKLVVNGDANAYAVRVDSNTTTGQAFGARIRAGTNSSDYALSVENTSASSMFAVRGDGNVGIGTTSPSAPLSLIKPSLTTTGTGEGGLRVHRPNATGQYGYFDYGYSGAGVNIGSLYSGGGASVFGTFTFRQHSSTTSQVPMIINNVGHVGIGKTISSPSYLEEVELNSTTSGTFNLDIYEDSILFLDTAMTANWTINVRGDVTTTNLNDALATGESVTVVCLATQGATPYYNNVLQINSVTQTVKWQGGTAPSAGNASSVDSYSYTIIKTGLSAYTVLGNQTQFA